MKRSLSIVVLLLALLPYLLGATATNIDPNSPLPAVCQGRLTLESGVAVSSTDQTAKSTLYFTPLNGNRICIYTGSAWQQYAFTERSLALSGLTSGANYDVFIYDNAGTLTLELSAAWTNATTRAGALTTQDGILVKSGATTRRFLGTIRTTGTTTTEDSGGGATTQVGGKRFVWNQYNRQRRWISVFDSTDSWSYTTATIRQANATAGNKVEYVTGDASTLIYARIFASVSVASNGAVAAYAGVGIDSTTTFSGLVQSAYNGSASAIFAPMTATFEGQPGLGYHAINWNEKGASTGTSTFVGDNAANALSGMQLTIEN